MSNQMMHENSNRLVNEKSPYLLQHAYNPVNWNPWCEEAFARAKAEDKPIFLSVGYSCCHWCQEFFLHQDGGNVRSYSTCRVRCEYREEIGYAWNT